jgi:hypothetical protein
MTKKVFNLNNTIPHSVRLVAPWHWDEVHQRAFNHIKATTAKDVVLVYPDYSKVFEIYTDASSKQLGAVITQDNRPMSFFSWKLSNTQCKYSIREKLNY